MYKIAIVGCGNMSGKWLDIVGERTDCDIVALVDVNLEAAMARKDQYMLKSNIYTSLEAALEKEELNLVLDITPPEYHFSTVTTALMAGCNVFGEKPMSDSLEKAYEMIECSDKTNKEYFVMQNRRYIPQIYAMRNFIKSNELGVVGQLSANFQLNPHFGGFREEMESPLIADMAIHTFDAARFILGKNPKSVYCNEFNPDWSWYKGNASAICIFEMEDGTVFDYRGSWCANGLNTSWESEWRATCENGSVSWNGHNKLQYEEVDLSISKDGISDEKSSKISKIRDVPQMAMDDRGHKACITEMFDALNNKKRPQTDCRDNIKSIEMVFKAIESAKTNKKIML